MHTHTLESHKLVLKANLSDTLPRELEDAQYA
jgi:hypothetical protein